MKKIPAFIFSLLIFTAAVRAGELTLADFMEKAVKTDGNFESIMLDKLKANYKKSLLLPAEDLILSVKGNYSLADYGKTGSVSLSKLFLPTGTALSAGYSISQPSGAYTSLFTAAVSQPVADNAFGFAYRLADEIAGFETEIARYQAVEAYEDYLARTISLYYTWYAAYSALKTAESSYKDSERLLENMQNKKNAGIAYAIDVHKTTIQKLEKQNNLSSMTSSYAAIINLVKAALNSTEDIVPVEPSIYGGLKLPGENASKDAAEKSRTLQVLAMITGKTKASESAAFSSLLPSVYLNAGVNVSGTGTGLAASEQNYYIGFTADLPLLMGGKEAAGYETAKASARQAKLSEISSALEYKAEIDSLYADITAQTIIVENTAGIVKFSESVMKEERSRYNQARSTLNDLITAVNTYERYKIQQIEQQMKLYKMVVEWYRLTDTLVNQTQLPGEIKN